jgi:tRNA pseudouridine38-40 synthase
MVNVRLTIEYLGTRYYGWQFLPDKPTVQGELVKALQTILRHSVKLTGASRTDAGVHARGQVANFKTYKEPDLHKLQRSLNGLLPSDIKVTEVEIAPPAFDARKCAKGKCYRYRLFTRSVMSPFETGRAWFVPQHLNIEAIKTAKCHLLGTHDFTSFSKTEKTEKVNPIRTVDEIVIKEGTNTVEFLFYGRSFLRHMVRVMVAVLVEVGKGKLTPEDVLKIREARSRTSAPFLAPACGLYLEKVYYEDYPYSR